MKRALEQEEFEELVLDAIQDLPQELLSRLSNVAIVVQQWPTREQLDDAGLEGRGDLLGLYEGIPLTHRESYNLALPDKITIFQGPLEAICKTRDDIAREVKETVAHEIAHHFGIDDERLHDMGVY